MTRSASRVDVVVVGGGIVGRSVASSAARRGMTVVVVEPEGTTFGTSSANAGHLVPSHVVPFAAPGMVRAGLRSLATRDGAFAIAPRSALTLVPWLWRFARASTRANVTRGVPVLRGLLECTVAEVQRLRAAGFEMDDSGGGILQVCTSATSLKGLRHEAEEWGRWGVRTDELDATALRSEEPLVHERALGAVRLTDDGRFDPALLLAAVTEEGRQHGVVTRHGRVDRLEVRGDRSVRVHSNSPVIDAAQVVVAAGVWTPALCRALGTRLPIVPARGDSVTLADAPKPRSAMLLVEQRLALNPLAQGLRVTGGFRLTRPADRAVDARRSQQLLHRAREVLAIPDGVAAAREWTGLRPATPDGLPFIGRLPSAPAVLVAAGHGMLGSTTGPGTGELVAGMLAGAPSGDDGVLSPARFTRRNGR